MEARADVVVVGGGLAGLTAARAIVAAGASAFVLEARDRVGGRTHSVPLGGGAAFDLGGQWIGPTQDRMAALVEELKVETFPTFDAGRKVLDVRGRRSTYSGTIPRMSPLKLALMQAGISRIEGLAQRVPADSPWAMRGADSLDGRTVEDWKRRTLPSSAVRGVFDAAFRTIFGAEPSEISLLHALWYLGASGGLMRVVEIRGGAQQTRFANGSQEVSLRLVEPLGDAVLLGAPVGSLEQGDDGVVARTGRGDVRGRLAIVAMPPVMAGRISYDPPLPGLRDELTQRFPMGATIKCHALYERAFWREEGYSGEAVLTEGPVAVVFDNTSADGQPALLAFSVGRAARALGRLGPDERRRVVLEVLARCFGPAAAAPLAYLDKDWSADPWTRGCPTAFMPPGVMTTFGPALREPCGRLHWAGTETATEWSGYMEGAVQSGERAAAEVLARL